MKTCFKCGCEKPFDEFYRHAGMSDGYLGKCKECAKQDARDNRRRRIDYWREYDRARGYHNSPDYIKKYRRENPERYKANTAIGNAVRDGRLMKPDTCSVCGEKVKIHAHHTDYSMPLKVQWLCVLCHSQIHAEIDP